MASRVAALLLLSIICTEFAAAEVPVDCCKKASKTLIPKKIIESYTILEAGQGCDISATVFITKGGKRLCAVHPSVEGWVRSHINFLDLKKNDSVKK
ncbi:C-C motif chemokine 24-like [Seriola dumerili]|uniref:C-C motif chemokine 24-like n=1 Tax=Seriola dumerili TaxID=41447 RepID=A0A3B4V921_SERDU|nr:C-C motif chemokine 24-like [Seriola dumerili]